MILIKGPNGTREVPDGLPYRLEVGESITGVRREQRLDKLDHIAADTKTGAGDLINALTTATGFKQWYNKAHRGECMPCARRQAALNYFQFKGPQWMHDWIESKKEAK